ncbi:cysteine-rich venom protein Mr30-like [Littorina saxatilis]|uniref:cysteine-rich venom protein Mr30-like n=1 Tax=Littorina saxatilis TaxID=31220 RepID=UPI0038B559CB
MLDHARNAASKTTTQYSLSTGVILSGGGSGGRRNGDVNTQLGTPGKKAVDTCTAGFKAIQGHTMCMPDDPRVTRTGVTAEDKVKILQLHNEARAGVQPAATDLTTLIWNDELAAVAQKWSQHCIMGHDKERSVPDLGASVGQNVAGGYRTWEAAIGGWHDEVKMYVFGRDPDSYLGKGGWLKIGHYTQMVQNTTHMVGCGFSACRGTKFGRYYVCNYASAQTRLAVPYTRGRRCSACPNSCRNGLCDCGGLVCVNGGTLNPDTCTCECPAVYSGPDCSKVNCPNEDPFYCGRDVAQGDCTTYFNVPHMCPYMCGVCTGGKKDDVINVNIGGQSAPPQEVFTSSFGCKYEGKRATPAECNTYGDKGADKQFCASQGGEFGCNECSLYYNIKRDYCPVMCGICDPPCGGKTCQNGGRLITDTCTCECKAPFGGDTCEKTNCPAEDQFHCTFYPDDFCTQFVNVAEECPFKCGMCKQ